MSTWNEQTFAVLNAHAGAPSAVIGIATLFADDAMWLVPLGLLACWLWGSAQDRRGAVEAMLAGLLALAIAQFIVLGLYHPRPFAVGLGLQLIPHVADSSFPSDHGTLLAAVAAGLLLRPQTRRLGFAFSLLWLPVAWSRIYLGVHFPADMLGGLLVGCVAATIVRCWGGWAASVAERCLGELHRFALAPIIRRGWVRP